jgi:hypothetical protein
MSIVYCCVLFCTGNLRRFGGIDLSPMTSGNFGLGLAIASCVLYCLNGRWVAVESSRRNSLNFETIFVLVCSYCAA